ncbi:FKBP-type peptidyl-prolyl cis-trans isomerase [Phytoactinopolyspora halophila]|uniref:FKBP-type peptidyl-prolyl cis-trans isomerase n=1 Tax=Phytoactinopolyspora halophila TaxID=1981511 RepID=UPI001313E0F6|nr:FKBP-type peptidyl-prolyl cis-trans isomerase [Phytoactinopolyspora halophila]
MHTRQLFTVLVAASGLVLAACGDDDGTDDTSTQGSGALQDVGVTGEFGDKPDLEIPDGDPSGELEVEVLVEGDGPEVAESDFVVANYLGQTWDERDGEEYVFDNSYDREQASGFSLNSVVDGWKQGLAGQKVGSRVLLSIPPELGYGEAEESQDGAEGSENGSGEGSEGGSEDGSGDGSQDGAAGGAEGSGEGSGASSQHDLAGETLVFVVDIVENVAPDAAATGAPAQDLPDDLPVVEGGETGPPEIDFGDAPEPEETDATIILEGDGPEVSFESVDDGGEDGDAPANPQAGPTVLVQMMEAPYPDGEGTQSTWELQGPEQVPAQGLASLPGWDAITDDLTVGSRVLTRISSEDAGAAAQGEEESPPLVLIVDVLATF